MQYVKQAVLDSVVGAGFARQDLSPVITRRTDLPRPLSQNMPQIRATQEIHQWRELNLNRAGTGAGSYLEGALPNTAVTAPVPESNVTCRIGYTAQVTDEMAAVWTGAGDWEVTDGEMTRRVTEAIDLQISENLELLLNDIEFMHVFGNQTNPQGTGVFPGGQTDGLLTWALAYGVVVTTGGTSAAPVAFQENFIKEGLRAVALGYPTMMPNKLLVTTELRTDIDAFIGTGAGRPLVQAVGSGPTGTSGFVAGQDVQWYRGSGVTLEIVTEPWLSGHVNQYIPPGTSYAIGYNDRAVKQASLIKLGSEWVARTDTSIKKYCNVTFAQEHRNPKHVFVIANVISNFTTAAIAGTP